MFKKIKYFVLVSSLFSIFLAGQVFAISSDLAGGKYGLNEAQGQVNSSGTILSHEVGGEKIIIVSGIKLVAYVLSFVGVLFFLLVLYAGILWMTAGGSADKVDKAKSILISSFFGVIIVTSAYSVASLVFKILLG